MEAKLKRLLDAQPAQREKERLLESRVKYFEEVLQHLEKLEQAVTLRLFERFCQAACACVLGRTVSTAQFAWAQSRREIVK